MFAQLCVCAWKLYVIFMSVSSSGWWWEWWRRWRTWWSQQEHKLFNTSSIEDNLIHLTSVHCCCCWEWFFLPCADSERKCVRESYVVVVGLRWSGGGFITTKRKIVSWWWSSEINVMLCDDDPQSVGAIEYHVIKVITRQISHTCILITFLRLPSNCQWWEENKKKEWWWAELWLMWGGW